MKILFMGTPDFAVPILESLHKEDKHQVLAVVCQPDRPKGRGHSLISPPVKEFAIKHGIPVIQPENLRKNDNFVEEITALGADIFVVVAYGKILPVRILNIPPLGCVNIHASLLPKYRGAAPMQWAIMNGEKETGITIQYMDKGMDTGDIILKKATPIEASDRFADIHDKMMMLSCECILETLELIATGTAKREPQNHEEATYAPMLQKENGLINWSNQAISIYNQLKALDPWPGTYTHYDGQVLKIWECTISDDMKDENIESTLANAVPGQVLETGKHLLVKCGEGALRATVLQGQGGKRMNAADYLRGRPIPIGVVFK